MSEIIVVDDIPSFTKNLNIILGLNEIELKVYEEPKEFLKFAETPKIYECKKLVVDYSMPEFNGYQVFKKLYELTGGNMPFKMLLFSANLEQIADEEKKFMKDIGVGMLQKPNIQKLLDFLEGEF